MLKGISLVKLLLLICIINVSVFSGTRGKGKQSSFFPLSVGSYWIYEQYMHGDLDDGFQIKDSVVSVTKTDLGLQYTLKRFTENSPVQEIKYLVMKTGVVYQQQSYMKIPESFTVLNPKPKDTVNAMSFSNYLNKEKTKIRLESSNYEEASYEEKMMWQAHIYEKNIGLISYGGAELVMKLVKHRILP